VVTTVELSGFRDVETYVFKKAEETSCVAILFNCTVTDIIEVSSLYDQLKRPVELLLTVVKSPQLANYLPPFPTRS
jgi:hypothetical protein